MADSKLCFQCDINPRLKGEILCKSCKFEHKWCFECGEKERNQPFKLCTDCYQAQRTEAVSQNKSILQQLDSGQQTYKDILEHFQKEWVKLSPKCPTPPKPQAIFAIQNKKLTESFQKYGDRIKQGDLKATNSDLFFHGTKLTCNLLDSKDCCGNSDCGVCGISSNGFDDSRIGSNITRFQRFGKGIYLAPNSSKCHDYTQGNPQGNPLFNVRAQLLCLVACGAKYELRQDNTTLTGPPERYDSVHGVAGGSLNYDEIVVFDVAAVLPQFIVVYELDGVEKIAK